LLTISQLHQIIGKKIKFLPTTYLPSDSSQKKTKEKKRTRRSYDEKGKRQEKEERKTRQDKKGQGK
jgi:hypothetical protein